eukprot:TRINITY_DN3834_c0_g1_i1.p1 TRINITY_DN3834_c0_g1~~TRINITY_DN3834_c0_g1_i1.p1  ORF type:complete len:483 (-),score=58.68 TRINITY_DN3834_c0_g1_i1:532-1980(-)
MRKIAVHIDGWYTICRGPANLAVFILSFLGFLKERISSSTGEDTTLSHVTFYSSDPEKWFFTTEMTEDDKIRQETIRNTHTTLQEAGIHVEPFGFKEQRSRGVKKKTQQTCWVQQGVDCAITFHITRDATAGIDDIVVVSGDSDFEYPIKQITKSGWFPNTTVWIAGFGKSVAPKLVHLTNAGKYLIDLSDPATVEMINATASPYGPTQTTPVKKPAPKHTELVTHTSTASLPPRDSDVVVGAADVTPDREMEKLVEVEIPRKHLGVVMSQTPAGAFLSVFNQEALVQPGVPATTPGYETLKAHHLVLYSDIPNEDKEVRGLSSGVMHFGRITTVPTHSKRGGVQPTGTEKVTEYSFSLADVHGTAIGGLSPQQPVLFVPSLTSETTLWVCPVGSSARDTGTWFSVCPRDRRLVQYVASDNESLESTLTRFASGDGPNKVEIELGGNPFTVDVQRMTQYNAAGKRRSVIRIPGPAPPNKQNE